MSTKGLGWEGGRQWKLSAPRVPEPDPSHPPDAESCRRKADEQNDKRSTLRTPPAHKISNILSPETDKGPRHISHRLDALSFARRSMAWLDLITPWAGIPLEKARKNENILHGGPKPVQSEHSKNLQPKSWQ